MCGICGYIGKTEIHRDDLKKMNNYMCKRGPDDSGEIVFKDKNYCIGMGHRRLSIIDLSEKGHQPMISYDNRVILVFNGEIYNYKELKEELDYPFTSDSDTEVIIASYLKWGMDCVTHFNGMFALALYDKEIHKLFLARDRFGKKPLYVYKNRNSFIYASSLYSIITNRMFNHEFDRETLKNYLVRTYSVSPKTIYKNVFKVCPGEVWEIENGIKNCWKYWDLYKQYDELKCTYKGNYNEAKSDLRKILEKAVLYRMHADVPVGILLSGGIDSSLVAMIAANVSKKPIETFTIGFEDKKFNEALYAKEIANKLGTKHHELYIGEKELLSLLDDIQEAYDEPFADSSQIATMHVAKLASDNGIKVLLSGDGGDEFFCGYRTYQDLYIAQRIDWIGEILSKFGLGSDKISKRLPFAVSAIISNRNPIYKTQFNMKNYIDTASQMIENGDVLFDESVINEKNWAIRRMLLDANTYLADDILHKVDRATMFYSVEARNPILDINTVKFAFSIKQTYKQLGKKSKRILRDLLYTGIPKEFFERPKSGFSVPISKWMKELLKEELKYYSSISFLKNQGIFNPELTERLIHKWIDNNDIPGRGQNMQEVIWAFYNFQKWFAYSSKLL